MRLLGQFYTFYFFFTIRFHKYKKAQSVYCFFQDKISEAQKSAINVLFFFQDKISQVQKSTKKHYKAQSVYCLYFFRIRFCQL